jgi:hypothetical protein
MRHRAAFGETTVVTRGPTTLIVEFWCSFGDQVADFSQGDSGDTVVAAGDRSADHDEDDGTTTECERGI